MDLLASAAATILGPESETVAEGSRELSFLSRKRRRATFEELASDIRDFHDSNDRRVSKILRLFSENIRRFGVREFFTATVDAPYFFGKDDFMDCLRTVGLAHVTRLQRKGWANVRSVICSKLGHPRRLSKSFLYSERLKLYASRKENRRNRENPPVSVGDVVTVRDPYTSLLFKGLVISTADNGPDFIGIAGPNSQPSSYIVQLDRVELGIEIYDDVDIQVHQQDSTRFAAEVVSYRPVPFGLRRTNSQHSLTSTSLSQSFSLYQGPAAAAANTQPPPAPEFQFITAAADDRGDDDSLSATCSVNSETEDNIFLSSLSQQSNSSHMIFSSSQRSTGSSHIAAADDDDDYGSGSSQSVFEEPKEMILKRCADSVKKLWPDCIEAAEKFVCAYVERTIGMKYALSEILPDEEFRDLIVRCIGSLLLIKDANGKWIPKYAEPVLVAIASGICEGCDVTDFRLIMSYFGAILSHL